MAERIKLVQGDTKPAIFMSLTEKDSGDPINLVASTVTLRFRKEGSSVLQATIVADLIGGLLQPDGTIDASVPYDTPGVGGLCQAEWAVGDLDCAPGKYEGEIEITFPDGTQTVYDILKFQVRGDF